MDSNIHAYVHVVHKKQFTTSPQKKQQDPQGSVQHVLAAYLNERNFFTATIDLSTSSANVPNELHTLT
jgi:hypothetical protein